ncbi:glycoside hydrolase family 10 protein [Bipolaris sorokiniana ND90Pr]|uniref:Beta-xylanase n=1 Tax=Cochliobolus sativus (strain ND90Pr / ATCC 201652) TaxID=665912 RepID=M2SAN0_COCSN|nr:glycoside hydrolase family 10 protein [Bipolaris sorokiniana ND90Pr]EMD59560.1 glycoside hydrolase family 10 protein [Bipolaris sorokiniana ND90Pr]
MHFRDASIYMAVVGLTSTTALAAVAPFGQCGGVNYKGDSACASGFHCLKYNDWYSQCIPGGEAAPPSASSTSAVPSLPSKVPAMEPNGTAPVAAPASSPAEDESCDADEEGGDAATEGNEGDDESCEADDEPVPSPSSAAISGGNTGVKPAASPSPTATSASNPGAKPTPSASPSPAAGSGGNSSAPNVAGSGRNGAKCNLDAAFKAKGKKYVGVATDQYTLSAGKNKEVIVDNFGCVTPENSMKWDATERSEGQFTLDGANALVSFATGNDKLVRGHTTVWHSQLAPWVSQIRDKAKLEEVMVNHIKKLVGTYAGKIYAWDVVNEIFDEQGGFRSSVFYNVLGEGFVSTAFHAARQADPLAKLYINDYNLDGANYGKTKGMITHVKKWIAEGVPIDGIGSQSHISSPGTLFPISGVPAALKALCDAAPECAVTELDINNGKPADWVTVFDACVDIKNCVGITVWGVSDTNSWIGAAGGPLLFDGSFKAKPSYNELCSALA